MILYCTKGNRGEPEFKHVITEKIPYTEAMLL